MNKIHDASKFETIDLNSLKENHNTNLSVVIDRTTHR